jgi:exodeoxyribonuclease III
MKIISYNINGIRSAISKGLINWLTAVDADVVCFQEIKASIDQCQANLFEQLGYHTYWYPAQKKGYSGVAILSKHPPLHVEYGCGIGKYDDEGRVLRIDFPAFSVLNVYMPSGSSGEIRHAFKMQWLTDFFEYIAELQKQKPHLIISGDYNIAHQSIDIHNPRANANCSGFLPVEREWLTALLNNGFIDTFRFFNDQPHFYTWWSFRAGARRKNLGWRIDYHLASISLQEVLKRSLILSDALHSDHCPVLLQLSH